MPFGFFYLIIVSLFLSYSKEYAKEYESSDDRYANYIDCRADIDVALKLFPEIIDHCKGLVGKVLVRSCFDVFG